MAEAYRCDRCEEFYEGTPHKNLAWGPTEDSARSRTKHPEDINKQLCEKCFQGFIDWYEKRDTGGLVDGE